MICIGLLFSLLLSYAGIAEKCEAADTSSVNHQRSAQSSLSAESYHRPGEVVVAGFGIQSVLSSFITIKAYQARTGQVMAEESFDLEVQGEGRLSEEATHGRIFAGGIELGQKDRLPFLLRVYDAGTGKFLWEGELNLNLKEKHPRGRLIAGVTPLPPPARRVDTKSDAPVQVYLSLRAIDLRTGRLLWQDKFMPGTPKAAGRNAVVFHDMSRAAHPTPIEHVFDLVVRTFDRQSGRLLWLDSFDESDDLDSIEGYDDDHIEPQTAPVSTWAKSHMAKLSDDSIRIRMKSGEVGK